MTTNLDSESNPEVVKSCNNVNVVPFYNLCLFKSEAKGTSSNEANKGSDSRKAIKAVF